MKHSLSICLAIRRLAALAAVWTAFVCLCPTVFAEEKPNLQDFPESSVILSLAQTPTVSLNGLEKNADEKAYPASITKILTALVALEQGRMSDLVTISAHAVNLSSANAKIGAKEGEVYVLEELLYGMLLPSGCDAARAVAEHIGGSEEGFAQLMNEKAQSLGMTHSHFTNASGLHHEQQYTTARDLAILGAAASENEALCAILATKTYTITEQTGGRTILVRNINRLVNDPRPGEYEKVSALYSWCIGGKTGSTNAAGRTYMAMARFSGVTLVCVLLGDKAPTAGTKGAAYDKIIANRFLEARSLFEYGYEYLFPEVSLRALAEEGLQTAFPIPVEKGETSVSVLAQVSDLDAVVSLYLPARQALATGADIRYEVSSPEATTPVYAGDAAGQVSCYYQQRLLFSLPLTFSQTVLPDPTPSPAPVLEVERRAYLSPQTAPAPVEESPPEKGDASLALLLVTLLLGLGAAAWFLIRRSKKKL